MILPLAALSRHLETQVRGATDRVVVRRYARAMGTGTVFPPLLAADVNGALVLVDGFHRRAAMEELGIEEAEIEIQPCKTLDGAQWLGFNANLRHGQPLRPRHYRPAFRAFIRAGNHKRPDGEFMSYREIATELPGLSYSTVRRWMQADFPAIFKAFGQDGGNPNGSLREGPSQESVLTRECEALVDDVRALMEGVRSPSKRARVAIKLREAALLIQPSDEAPFDFSTLLAV